MLCRYDAVWTAALVLDETAKEESGEVKARELLPTWNALEFDGATGHVAFDSKRDRSPNTPPTPAASAQLTRRGSRVEARVGAEGS